MMSAAPDEKRPTVLAAFLAAICFALSTIFARRSIARLGVARANFARLWTAFIFLAGWAHLHGGGLRGAGLWVFILSGGIGFGLGDLALFGALPLIGSRLTALMVQCLAAPAAALIEWLWLGTRLTGLELLSGATILAGVAVAVAPTNPFGQPTVPSLIDTSAHRRGLLFGCLAALGQAGGAVVSRKAHAISQLAGFQVDGGTAAYQRILGGLVVVTVAFLWAHRGKGGKSANKVAEQPVGKMRAAWPWVLANSLAGAVLGVSCYQWALSTTPSAIVMPIVALTPLVVVPFAFVIEHERPSARSLVGGALAVAGAVVLATQR